MSHINKLEVRRLWELGFNDKEIAAELGHLIKSVASCRRRLGLLPHGSKHGCKQRESIHKYLFLSGGVSMESTLSPVQCHVARRFLSDLLWCAKQRRPGWTMNITEFMRVWRVERTVNDTARSDRLPQDAGKTPDSI